MLRFIDTTSREYWERKEAKVHGDSTDEDFDSYAKWVIEILEPEENETILDIGCGEGSISKRVKEKSGADFSGLDFSGTLLRTAKKNVPQLSCILCDALKGLPFKDGCFDKIVSFTFFQYVPHAQARHVIKECKRVFKQGGLICHLDIPDRSKVPTYFASLVGRAVYLFCK